jgi:hypothetical protein
MIAETYLQGIDKYKKEGSEDEWYFSNLSDEASKNVDTFEAFEAIDKLVESALTEQDGYLFYNLIYFIITLAGKSNTTQSPELLKFNYALLKEKASKFGRGELKAVDELGRYYRFN